MVCSNLRSKSEVYRRFYDTVITAISETDRISILPSFENASGHIRLKDLEADINRADTIVVICFDQEWQWATNVMREIRQLLKSDTAKRVRLLIIGPQAKASVSLDTRAFRFTTLDAHAMDEEHLRGSAQGCHIPRTRTAQHQRRSEKMTESRSVNCAR